MCKCIHHWEIDPDESGTHHRIPVSCESVIADLRQQLSSLSRPDSVELDRTKELMPAGSVILCGPTCGHDHDSLNGPTGCCPKHGPYMYYCPKCHDRSRA